MDINDIDRFLSESVVSFKHAETKNSARRGSLMKKTKDLELQRKMATAQMSKEERQLRESLRAMKVEQHRNHSVRVAIAKSKEMEKMRDKKPPLKKCPSADVDPYPVTFPVLVVRTPSPSRHSCSQSVHGSPTTARKRPDTAYSKRRPASASVYHLALPRKHGKDFEEKGKQHARTRGRRVSREFEDLHLCTNTGSLRAISPALVGSSKILFRGLCSKDFEGSGSGSSLSSIEDLYWAGEPEAIASVRRAKKNSEQQYRDVLIKRSLTDLHRK